MNKLQLTLGLVAVCLLAVGTFQCLADDRLEEFIIENEIPIEDESILEEKPVAEPVEDPNNPREVIEIVHNGVTYSAPVYENVKMTEARKAFDRGSIGRFVSSMHELIDMIMVKKRSVFVVGKKALSVVNMARIDASTLKTLQKTDKSPPMAPGYAKTMGDLMSNIIGMRSSEKITAEEAARRSDGILDAVEMLTIKSPTGLYMDFTKLLVDGQPLKEHVGPVIQWLRSNGYGVPLKIFEGFAAVVRTFSG